ncbi:MAG TPA: hypothetical protein VHR41_02410 [Gemmatimonadales bacterium]|nr:hypothetical protein [Gemmatimonadales bacterium]
MRPLTSTFLFLLAAVALAGPVLAQSTDEPDRPGGGGDMPRGRHGGFGMMHGRRMEALDPVVADGPPAPDEFAKIASPPEDQRRRYAELYQRFMASTKPQRDSLNLARREMIGDFQDGDREGAGRQRDVMMPLGQELASRQKTFDETLKSFLGKDQWKHYDKWRSDERKRAEQERRELGRRRRPRAGLTWGVLARSQPAQERGVSLGPVP